MATFPGYKMAARPNRRHLSERASRAELRRQRKKKGEEREGEGEGEEKRKKWFSCAVDDNNGKFVLVFCKSIFFKYCRLAINSSRKIAADGSPSGGGVSLCGSDHLCDRWISDPTIPVECQPDHPFSIRRCEGGADDLWFDSALSFAPGPNRFPLAYWWPLAHPLVIFSPAPRACSCARAGQRGKQCPVPSAWSFLAFFCNAFNAHRVAAPEVFPVSPFTCLSHSWQQRGPVSFPVCARCYSAFLSS